MEVQFFRTRYRDEKAYTRLIHIIYILMHSFFHVSHVCLQLKVVYTVTHPIPSEMYSVYFFSNSKSDIYLGALLRSSYCTEPAIGIFFYYIFFLFWRVIYYVFDLASLVIPLFLIFIFLFDSSPHYHAIPTQHFPHLIRIDYTNFNTFIILTFR